MDRQTHRLELPVLMERVSPCRRWQKYLPLIQPFVAGKILLVKGTTVADWIAGRAMMSTRFFCFGRQNIHGTSNSGGRILLLWKYQRKDWHFGGIQESIAT